MMGATSEAWTLEQMPDQTGRVAIVTGANAGLGFEISAALAARGAHVVLACRNLDKAEAAAATLGLRIERADLAVRRLDLADLSSVAAFVTTVTAEYDRVDLLVNNAGLMAIDESRTVDGFETQFGVNHLGHFALTAGLLPMLTRTPGSRVATMSSMGHRAGRMDFEDLMQQRRYGRWRAYFQSKLANLLFTAELQRRLAEAQARTQAQTIAVAAHPGGSRTDLGLEGAGVTNRLMRVVATPLTQPAAIGALPLLRAATDPDVRGGQYFGPRFLMAGLPVLETPSRRARDLGAAQRLWQESIRLTGATPDQAIGPSAWNIRWP